MSRRTLSIAAALSLAALALGVWWSQRSPNVARPGGPLPFDEPVQMHFPADETSEAESWRLVKKRTTREDALAIAPLPEPDPAGRDHVPDESARTLDGLALEAWKSGEIERALEIFEESIAADPDDRVPRSHLGRLLTLSTDYDRALPHLERAAALDPEDPQVWLDLQSLFERALVLERAFEARRRAVDLAGDRPISQNEMGFYEVEGSASFP